VLGKSDTEKDWKEGFLLLHPVTLSTLLLLPPLPPPLLLLLLLLSLLSPHQAAPSCTLTTWLP
jgi:hypothetical protein